MNDNFQKVNKKRRNQLLFGYLISLIIFIVLLLFLVPFFKEIYNNTYLYEIIQLADLLHLSIFILVAIPAIYLIRTGIKIIIQKRYPYKGMILIQDMKILEGKDAIKIGRRLIILGIVTLLFLISSIILTRKINRDFIKNPFNAVNYNISSKILKFFPGYKPIENEPSNENR